MAKDKKSFRVRADRYDRDKVEAERIIQSFRLLADK